MRMFLQSRTGTVHYTPGCGVRRGPSGTHLKNIPVKPEHEQSVRNAIQTGIYRYCRRCAGRAS